MAVFNAGTILESLDYDFTALAGSPNNICGLAEAKGTIREPTSLQVQAFMQASAREMQRLRREARAAVADSESAADDGTAAGNGTGEPAGDGDVTDEQLAVLADADAKRGSAARRREAAMYSKLCSGEPSADVLLLLPHRIMAEFGRWLVKEVMDPEAVTGAGSPHLQMVRSPAAG